MLKAFIILSFWDYFFNLLLYFMVFFAFQVVAVEWFGMWISKVWNSLPDAIRLVNYMFLVLIFISLKNDD
ncbi:DUF2165 family protein [Campylobacter sp. US55]|uniref:DUF2165 family protein n=1 Tax=Campylobacter sp. US55 TaxID=2498126 RepID=UPI001ABA4B7B|nr:DUF2165 family protein [Campylobacter sp. US55]